MNITSTTAADLQVLQTDAQEWSVTDNGVPVGAGTFTGVTGNVRVTTSNASDSIDVDLNGFTAPRSILIQAGAGNNNIVVRDGTISSVLDIRGGSGEETVDLTGLTVNQLTQVLSAGGDDSIMISDGQLWGRTNLVTGTGADTVNLGDGATPLTLGKFVLVLDGGGPLDALTVSDQTTIRGTLQTHIVNSVVLEEGSEIQGNVYVTGGLNVTNELLASGTIDGSLRFAGSGASDQLHLSATSQVGGSVVAFLNAGDDEAIFEGVITRILHVESRLGNDSILLDGTVGTQATILMGGGNDLLSFTGRVGIAPSTSARLVVAGGEGNDQVALRAASQVNGQATVNMAAGDDEFALDDLAVIGSGLFNGGSGTDKYFGTRPRANATDTLFEQFALGPSPF